MSTLFLIPCGKIDTSLLFILPEQFLARIGRLKRERYFLGILGRIVKEAIPEIGHILHLPFFP